MGDYFSHERNELKFLVPGDAELKVLEVGAGEGNFSLHFVRPEYWAVELNELLLPMLKEKAEVAFAGDFFSVEDEIPNDYFDVVVLNDVIEHIPDHKRFLIAISKKLNDQGCVLGSIPNFCHYENLWHIFRGKYNYTADGIRDYTHLRNFTADSFRGTLATHHFIEVSLHGINSRFSPDEPLTWRSTLLRFLLFIISLFNPSASWWSYYQIAFKARK